MTNTLPSAIALTGNPASVASLCVRQSDGTIIELNTVVTTKKKKKNLYVAVVTTEDGDVMVFGPYTDKGKAEDKGERKMMKYISNNAVYHIVRLEK